jgi:hypothetical protein
MRYMMNPLKPALPFTDVDGYNWEVYICQGVNTKSEAGTRVLSGPTKAQLLLLKPGGDLDLDLYLVAPVVLHGTYTCEFRVVIDYLQEMTPTGPIPPVGQFICDQFSTATFP